MWSVLPVAPWHSEEDQPREAWVVGSRMESRLPARWTLLGTNGAMTEGTTLDGPFDCLVFQLIQPKEGGKKKSNWNRHCTSTEISGSQSLILLRINCWVETTPQSWCLGHQTSSLFLNPYFFHCDTSDWESLPHKSHTDLHVRYANHIFPVL